MSLPQPSTDAGRAALAALLARPATALVAFDFDGTLAPIVDDPRDSAPYPGIVATLAALSPLIGTTAVITGRAAATVVDLGGLERVPNLTVLGHYGAERWSDGEVAAADPPPGVELVRAELPGLVARVGAPEGTFVEDKGRALAVHTRRTADPDAALARLAPHLEELAARADLRLEPGRMVIELRPQGVDKGAALTELATAAGAGTVLYGGDDLGDLPAFDAVREMRAAGTPGLTVCASSSEVTAVAEAADLVVDGPAGLAAFLTGLTDSIRAPGA